MLEVTHLSKSFDTVAAVRDVSFTVRTGEIIGLLGPNGAGKSTTMRMITGYLTPDAGTIRVDGIDVVRQPQAAKRRIGYLPESAPLYVDMEVTDFLHYIATLRGVPRTQQRERVRAMVARCGLRDVVGRPIGQLSKGYRQRVGLAAAMIHQPQLLILDEPTTGLDPNQIQEIRQVIRELGAQCTIILSTHIMQEVEAMCDRALIINRGQLAAEGALATLVAQRSAGVRYAVLVDAAESLLRSRMPELAGAQLVGCRPVEAQWHEATFATTERTQGDDVFQWIVANGWRLRELRREAASLEDVFRELTQ